MPITKPQSQALLKRESASVVILDYYFDSEIYLLVQSTLLVGVQRMGEARRSDNVWY